MSEAKKQMLTNFEPQGVSIELPKDVTPLRFITCGSVDDGKSTLIGRLLWDTKAVMDDQVAGTHSSQKHPTEGLELPDFANLLDGLQAEREQGITIDVAYRYFSTNRRSFIVADTPGHAQYTRNMATGASTADLAILLVDARAGILEQTKRHATIVSLMGIKQIVLAVNKIDLVDYDQSKFNQIAHQFEELAASLNFEQITMIPTSALRGENVAFPAGSALSWYQGPTLLETLELATRRSAQSVGFRLSVQRVCRPDESFRGYQGTVTGGAIKPGDSVAVLPSGTVANVEKIVTFDLIRNAAVAGDAVTLVLDRHVDVSRGDMIVSNDARPLLGKAFDARMVVLDDQGLTDGKRYWLKSGSRQQWVKFTAGGALDLETGQWGDTPRLLVNEILQAVLHFDDLTAFDTYRDNRDTGSFILIDPQTNNTVTGGMITGQTSDVVPLKTPPNDNVSLMVMPQDLARDLLNSDQLKAKRSQVQIYEVTRDELDKWLHDQA